MDCDSCFNVCLKTVIVCVFSVFFVYAIIYFFLIRDVNKNYAEDLIEWKNTQLNRISKLPVLPEIDTASYT